MGKTEAQEVGRGARAYSVGGGSAEMPWGEVREVGKTEAQELGRGAYSVGGSAEMPSPLKQRSQTLAKRSSRLRRSHTCEGEG